MQELVGTGQEFRGTAIPVDRHALIEAAFETYHGELYGFLRRGTRDETAAKGGEHNERTQHGHPAYEAGGR